MSGELNFYVPIELEFKFLFDIIKYFDFFEFEIINFYFMKTYIIFSLLNSKLNDVKASIKHISKIEGSQTRIVHLES